VKDTVAIQYLNFTGAMIRSEDNKKLLVVEAHGYSENDRLGVPRLVLKPRDVLARRDMIELDFVVDTVEVSNRGQLDYEVKTVFNVEDLPVEPKWIKVNAALNADIIFVLIN
jgi:hypothetical protein